MKPSYLCSYQTNAHIQKVTRTPRGHEIARLTANDYLETGEYNESLVPSTAVQPVINARITMQAQARCLETSA